MNPWAAPLIHMIPQRIMMEIILTGKPITAQRAYEIGLVNRLAEPEAVNNPFFNMAPDWLLLPLVVLATAATGLLAFTTAVPVHPPGTPPDAAEKLCFW